MVSHQSPFTLTFAKQGKSAFFAKKAAKKLYPFRQPKRQKFFGPFFQKRTACLGVHHPQEVLVLLPTIVSMLLHASPAAAGVLASCPAIIKDGGHYYGLTATDLFQGPPQYMADLVSIDQGNRYFWFAGESFDAYLTCAYDGTQKSVVLHVTGATYCGGRLRPLTGECLSQIPPYLRGHK